MIKSKISQAIVIIELIVSLSNVFYSQAQTLVPDYEKAPKLKWKKQFPKSFFGSPVIDADLVYFGGVDSNLYAIQIETGNIKWQFKSGGDIRSTPLIKDDTLFLVSGDGCLYCLNKHTGKQIWKYLTGGDKKYSLYSFADYFQSSPIIDNDLVFFGSGDNNLYAINSSNGTLVWKAATGDIIHSTPAIGTGRVYVGSFDGYFYAFDKTDGRQLWKFKSVGHQYFPKGEMQGSPAVYKHTVFVGSRDYNFYALDDSAGYARWNKNFEKGWAMTTPVFKDGVVFVGTSDDHLLNAYTIGSGALKWSADLKFNIFGSPVFSENKLYVATLMGRVYCIDQKTGKIEWSFNNSEYETSRLDFFKVDDTYRDDIGEIFSTGEKYISGMEKLGAIFSKPAICDNYIILTTVAGTVICYKRD